MKRMGVLRGRMPHLRKWGRGFVAMAALLALAGCGGADEGAARREAESSRTEREAAKPQRPPTPEEAMELDLATPLAASVENWIADTDVGDAWVQAKENVADLRARLVADWNARQESQVGETAASLALRKDYDRWLRIHDRLKAFVLDCRASGELRELPPELAKEFKNWSKLRRELLRDAPGAMDALEADFAAMREEYAALKAGGGNDAERLASVEALAGRFAARRAEAEGLKGDAEAVARHHATDDAVAGIAERAGDVAAMAKSLGDRMDALRVELHDGEAVRAFEAKTLAFVDGVKRMDSLAAGKAEREGAVRALTAEMVEDIRAKDFSRLAEYRGRLAELKAASEEARGDELACARAVKEVAKNFAGTLGAKAVRAMRHELASEASVARLEALSKEAETEAARHGKSLEGALLSLQTAAFKLEDGGGEREAFAEAEKRLARLEAMAER
ncbi:MAG: hypothetical protein IJT88_03655 [Kiritimatiellae bacterium]|nr:hypothetical protein [Kiritimatiellia bacterium]